MYLLPSPLSPDSAASPSRSIVTAGRLFRVSSLFRVSCLVFRPYAFITPLCLQLPSMLGPIFISLRRHGRARQAESLILSLPCPQSATGMGSRDLCCPPVSCHPFVVVPPYIGDRSEAKDLVGISRIIPTARFFGRTASSE